MVYHVAIIAPNGNISTRPIVADSPWAAIEIRRAEAYEQMNGDVAGLTYEVTLANDPDKSYERALLDMERRRAEAEYYAVPRARRRR